MSSETRYSDYDAMDRIFPPFSEEVYKVYLVNLEKLVLQYIPKRAHIFDLCCGRGELTQLLQEKGYQVIGLDGSEVSLRYARENAPGVEFILDDARSLKFPSTFHAVVSIGSSLDHVISIEELENVFKNVYEALLENGIFALESYSEEDALSHYSVPIRNGHVEDDYVWIGRLTYDREKKVLRENYTEFQLLKGEWQRSDVTLLSRAYSPAEIQSVLKKVGFMEVRTYDEERDLGVSGRAGKTFFVCRKLLK
ncbi:MAG: class I SAM-dependent methyltransferase [Iphinoe sp. HA4291-MV1]|nr:class I SAM-dependent methyltransferase [Iphinoe sp. HA4291-MV1]